MRAAKRQWGRWTAIGAVALLIGGGGVVAATSASAADVGMNSFRIYMKEGETKSFPLESQFKGEGTRLSSIVSTAPIGSSPTIETPVATGNTIKITTPTSAKAAAEGMSWNVVAEVVDNSSAKATNTFQIIVMPFSCPNQLEFRNPITAGEVGNVNVRSQCKWDSIYVPDQSGMMGISPTSVIPNEVSMRGLAVTQASPAPLEVGSLSVDATGSSVTAGPDIITYRYTDTVGRSDVAKAVFFIKGPAAQLQRDVAVDYQGTATVPVATLTGLPDQDYGPDSAFVTAVDTKASKGTAEIAADGSLSYTAPSKWSGTDTVTVSTKWRTGVAVMADVVARTTVTFTVAPEPLAPAPVANDITVTMNQGESVEVDVIGAATGDNLIIVGIGDPKSGTVTKSATNPGAVVYTPEPDFAGVDSVLVGMVDATQRGAAMTIHITVLAPAPPIPPVVEPPAPTVVPAAAGASPIAVTGPMMNVALFVGVALGLGGLGVFLVRRRKVTS